MFRASDLVARNAGVLERLVEQCAGRPHKRLTLPIFLIARLLADQHHARGAWSRAQDHLGGRLVQVAAAGISIATLLGAAAAWVFGWGWTSALVFGLTLSVASTVVLVRVLSDTKQLHTSAGHIAVGWLVVEDLFTVIMLVLLPTLVGGTASVAGVLGNVALTLAKVVLLVAFAGFVGMRTIPKLLDMVAATRSRELFTLTVLLLALGIAAGSTVVFGVSMALGAFIAGMAVIERGTASSLQSEDRAVVVGYGPTGRTVARLLRENGIQPTVIELNIDTVRELREEGTSAVYRDARSQDTLVAAGVRHAATLIISGADSGAPETIRAARELNPSQHIFARGAYLRDVPKLRAAGAGHVFSGEGEVALAMTEAVLRRLGATPDQIDRERQRLHGELFGPEREAAG